MNKYVRIRKEADPYWHECGVMLAERIDHDGCAYIEAEGAGVLRFPEDAYDRCPIDLEQDGWLERVKTFPNGSAQFVDIVYPVSQDMLDSVSGEYDGFVLFNQIGELYKVSKA